MDMGDVAVENVLISIRVRFVQLGMAPWFRTRERSAVELSDGARRGHTMLNRHVGSGETFGHGVILT